MTDDPRGMITVSAAKTENLDIYIPDSTKKNVREYLDIPCIEAEIYNITANKNSNKQHLKQQKNPPPQRCSTKCEATISIIRHCEKDVAREHCSYIGYEHSLYLSTLFGNLTTSRWPVPAHIFALAPGERDNKYVRNWREVEMVEPLGHDNNLTIDYSFGQHDTEDLVKHIFGLLRSGELCGKLVLISWKRSNIPHLAESLGCGHNNGCPKKYDHVDFDSLWEIQYSYHKLLNSPVAALEENVSPFAANLEDAKAKKKKDERKSDTKMLGSFWKSIGFKLNSPVVTKGKKTNKLKKTKSYVNKQLWGKYPIWHVFGTVQSQGFDALEFSKQMGEYQEGNRDSGYWLDTLYKRDNEEEKGKGD